MAVKRIFQIAKELGVDSKELVKRCVQEEIPNITNHMSVVSIGLEATLREWFQSSGSDAAASLGGGEATAVEVAPPPVETSSGSKARKGRSDAKSDTPRTDSKTDGQGEGKSPIATDGKDEPAATDVGVTGAAKAVASSKPSVQAGTVASSATAGDQAATSPTAAQGATPSEAPAAAAKSVEVKPKPVAVVPAAAKISGPRSVRPASEPYTRPAPQPQVPIVDPTLSKARRIEPSRPQPSSSISTTAPASIRVAPRPTAPPMPGYVPPAPYVPAPNTNVSNPTVAASGSAGVSATGVSSSAAPASGGNAKTTPPGATGASGQYGQNAGATGSPSSGPSSGSAGSSSTGSGAPNTSATSSPRSAPVNIARSSISMTRPAGSSISPTRPVGPLAPTRVDAGTNRQQTPQPASSLSQTPTQRGGAQGRAGGPGGRDGSRTDGGQPPNQSGTQTGPQGQPQGPSDDQDGQHSGSTVKLPPTPSQVSIRTSPAPMNVPLRPTGVIVPGPKLETKTKVQLSGPKVVRIEAPEQVQAPRPRRTESGDSRSRPGSPGAAGGAARGGRRDGVAAGPPGAAKRSSGSGVPERRRGRSDTGWGGAPTTGFSETDLIEREERLARAGGFLKRRKQDAANKAAHDAADEEIWDGRVKIAAPFTIKDLSAATGVKGSEIVKRLFLQGVMKKINDAIEVEKAIDIMMEFDIELDVTQAKTAEETVSSDFATRESKDIRPRGPIVTILGHVDHGKTSLLDKIRNTNVAAGEAGGITQKTSAFIATVDVEGHKREVVFLDTPGHEAFTSMRSRGAKMTDVVVLVVSAPEGVMPQTIESINHAKAAKVPIVVALNKIDRADATDAQVQKTLGELAKAGLNPAEWGGDTEVIRTSAQSGVGIKELLEALDYQSQLLELKADFDGSAQGVVVESKMEEGRGAVANLLIQQGKLRLGDFVVMGRSFGRIRDISDDKGKRVKEVVPPMPVQISGIDQVCDAGDKFYVVDSLKKAMEAAEQRRQRERQITLAQPKVTLDSIFTQISDKSVKEILVVLKTDQQGTVDVLKAECEKVKSAEVKVRVLHSAVGGITESDVLLADASRAIIIGFNVIPSGKARQLSEHKGVEIRTYQVIYDITDDLRKAAEGLLAPELREEVLGHAEVRQVFRISKVGSVAGCYITDGVVQREAFIRVTRNGVVVEHDRKLAQLKRLKDDAKEVRAGMECGMKIDGYDDIKDGDVLECYKKIEVKRTL